MSARLLRDALASRYPVDVGSGIFVRPDQPSIAYADGAEAYVAQVVAAARDLGVGSPELGAAIRDWPSQYHLSGDRSNLLRPVAPALGDRILEVGAGCGALTRFLGETGATVLAVEGSLERARIAAARCRDLDNVVVLCERFDQVRGLGPFTSVTLVGVLEYSRVFAGGEDAVQGALEHARDQLAAGGRLVVAIENQLGLKYLAGAPEDHLGEPFTGVAGLYERDGAVTFGRRELALRIETAGFTGIEMLYPFPDYKLPAVVLREGAFDDPSLNVGDLLATANAARLDPPGERVFSEALARDVFLRNGLGAETANSFLVLASTAPAMQPLPATPVLAHIYSTGRDRPFATEARIERTGDALSVTRSAIFDGVAGSPLQSRRTERYIEGEVCLRELQRAVARRGWRLEDTAASCEPWIALLRGAASADGALPGKYFDCTPFNVVCRGPGAVAEPFDLEWEPPDGQACTVSRVVFRGLWNSFLRLDYVATPAAGVPLEILELVEQMLGKLELRAERDVLLGWLAQEYSFTGRIAGIDRQGLPELPSLRVAGGAGSAHRQALERLRLVEALRQLSAAGTRIVELEARHAEAAQVLARPHHRLADVLGDAFLPFPRVRAILRAPLTALASGLRRILRVSDRRS